MVVPAINRTTEANAGELYATTIARPLSEAGFYVFSIPYIERFLRREGVVDGEQIANLPVEKFKDLFGADAVLFVTINSWDTNYYLIAGNVTVSARFDLKSTMTSETLWTYNAEIIHETSGDTGSVLADLIDTAITTALTDYIPVANQVNTQIISTLPIGHYNEKHKIDGDDVIFDKKTERIF